MRRRLRLRTLRTLALLQLVQKSHNQGGIDLLECQAERAACAAVVQ